MNSIFWFFLGIILIISEIFIPGMIIIFFGLSALIISLLVYFGILLSIPSQFFSWAIISLFLVILLRRFFKNLFPSLEIKQNVKDNLIEKTAIVIEEINPLQGSGRVEVLGTTWKAFSLTGEIIPVGEKVLIKEQKDFMLYVTLLDS